MSILEISLYEKSNDMVALYSRDLNHTWGLVQEDFIWETLGKDALNRLKEGAVLKVKLEEVADE